MTPFHFGATDRRLFGIYHPMGGHRQPSVGVLLCNPFGQEAVRLHRFYKVLADRLSRAGLHVLRFDYFGTGDAAGDDEQGDLEGWRQDVLTAHQELQQRSMCQKTLWVGARLGASLAALASGQAQRPPDRLVLWEPITDGAAYLRELAEGHARAINHLAHGDPARIKVATARPQGEAIGFGMSDQLVDQLARLSATDFAALKAADVLTVTNPDHASTHRLAGRTSPLQHAFDWTSEEALNTALVPGAALQMLASLIEEPIA